MKNLLSEIMRGTWLLDVVDPSQYQRLASAVLAGNFNNQEKPSAYNIIGKTTYDSMGKAQVKDKVAVISMIGEMTKYNSMCSYGAEYYAQELLKMQNDPEVKGAVLRLDGPGGNADALPIFEAIEGQITKPVVALVDRACSLHYFIAATQAYHIMMNNTVTAEVGSIGVMVAFEKPDKELIIVRPKQSLDKNQSFIEALAGETAKLEAKLEPLAIHFQNRVTEKRPQVKEETLHGNTYYAHDAVANGLADSIGDITKAYNMIVAKSELQQLK